LQYYPGSLKTVFQTERSQLNTIQMAASSIV